MNKNNRKKKGLSKRVLALMLCCCLVVSLPLSAMALQTEDTIPTGDVGDIQSPSELDSETSEDNGVLYDIDLTDGQENLLGDDSDGETSEQTGEQADEETDEETGEQTDSEQTESPVDILFEKLMACTTMAEMTAMQNEMTPEEWTLAEQFTDEQNYALSLKMNELGTYAAYSLEEQDNTTEINPDLPFIRVKKVIKGISADKIPAGFYDTFTVLVDENSGKMTAGTTEKTWEFHNLDAGTYKIKETGAEIEGYDLSVDVDGVPLTPEQKEQGIQVEVKAADALVSQINPGTSQGGGTTYSVQPGTMFVGHNSNDNSVIIISHSPIELTIRKAIEPKLKALKGWSKNPTFTYYNLSQFESGSHLTAGSISFTYNGDSITFDGQSNYNKYATTVLTINEAENASITITNTYTPKVCDLTISKTVGGNMGDQSKEFAFTATLSGEDYTFDGVTYSINNGETQSAGPGTECTFNLKHGDSITFIDLPIGATFTVTETSYSESGYVTTVDGETRSSKTITLAETNSGIAFVNRKDVTVDTGVLLDTLPYILILCVVAVGSVLLIKKRRNRDDD